MEKVRIIVPCFNEESCVEELYQEVDKVFSTMPEYKYSILYIDDGSRDCTLQKLQELKSNTEAGKVNFISFSRNFGKEAAIYAEFSNIGDADYVALMDADLQHPPELLKEMLKKLKNEAIDCCGARRIDRKGEAPVRSFFSNLFYKFINKVTCMKLVPGGSDFRIMTRQMAETVVTLSETERFTKGILSWVGFKTEWIEYENRERFAGTTKWSFAGLAKYAISGFMAFATTPLRAVIYLGIIIVVLAFVYACYVFYAALKNPESRTGYSSIILLILFIGGIIITLLGVIGEYLARIYMEVKHRPIYISKITEIDDQKEKVEEV